jgi:hypothetical protein
MMNCTCKNTVDGHLGKGPHHLSHCPFHAVSYEMPPADLDLNGRTLQILMPDGSKASLLGYIVRDAGGAIQVMAREDAEVERDEVFAALHPTQPKDPSANTTREREATSK